MNVSIGHGDNHFQTTNCCHQPPAHSLVVKRRLGVVLDHMPSLIQIVPEKMEINRLGEEKHASQAFKASNGCYDTAHLTQDAAAILSSLVLSLRFSECLRPPSYTDFSVQIFPWRCPLHGSFTVYVSRRHSNHIRNTFTNNISQLRRLRSVF